MQAEIESLKAKVLNLQSTTPTLAAAVRARACYISDSASYCQ